MTMETGLYLTILVYYCTIIILHSETTNSSYDIILKRYNETGQFPSFAEILGKQIDSLLIWQKKSNFSLSDFPEDPFLSPEYEKLTDDLKKREQEAASEQHKCIKSVTTINGGKNPCKGELIFEDDFNLPILNSSKWNVETRFSTEPDYEFVLYMNLTKNIFIRRGKLTINPTRLEKVYGENFLSGTLSLGPKCTGELNTNECIKKTKVTILPPIISGRINTNNRFKFKYGRIELRARLSVDAWIFPLILLEPAVKFYGRTRLESGQIRLAYANSGPVFNDAKSIINNSAVFVSGGILLGVEEPFRSMKMCNFTTISRKFASSPSIRWTNKFHNFTMEWLPDGFTFYINGHQYCHIDPGEDGFYSIKSSNGEYNPTGQMWKNHNRMAPYDREFYLTFGVGVGGFNDFPDNENKPWRNYAIQALRTFWNVMKPIEDWPSKRAMLKIDYVRIYAL